jgi:hypothetical protein
MTRMAATIGSSALSAATLKYFDDRGEILQFTRRDTTFSNASQ